MLQKSLESQQALARAEQNKLVSEFIEKNNNTQERKHKWSFHPDAKKHAQVSMFILHYYDLVFLLSFLPVASQKCSELCVNSCVVYNYVDIYRTKQQREHPHIPSNII